MINVCRTISLALLLAGWLAGQPSAAAAASEEPVKPGEFIPAKPPQPAPEISFTDLDGKPVTLADFHGKPILLNLWATWCQPCLKEMPSLAHLPAALGGGFVLLVVSEDRGAAKVVAPFLDKLGLDKLGLERGRIYLDPKSAVGHAFEVRGLPTTFVIDAKGQVQGHVEGAADWDSAKMQAIIKPLLQPATDAEPVLKHAER